jgi:hypothetical protein
VALGIIVTSLILLLIKSRLFPSEKTTQSQKRRALDLAGQYCKGFIMTNVKVLIAKEYLKILRELVFGIILIAIIALFITIRYNSFGGYYDATVILTGQYNILFAWYLLLVYPLVIINFIRFTKWAISITNSEMVQNDHINQPKISGGDASSIQSLAIINCSSPKMAYTLIYDFISKKQGQKDTDWKEIERNLCSADNGNVHICKLLIELRNRNRLTYYFDISQSMQFAQKLSDVILNKQA